ncbi:MAG TPA: autotransporter-associated beta strand repeat-containing protein, partial [Pirellulales bacterium]
MAIASLGCLIAASWRPSPVHAATYTWDADGNDANNAQDGSGTWSTTDLNWFLNNTTADIGWTNNTTDIAAFGVSGGTGGTITLGGSFSAGGIQFTANDSGSFSITGTQTLTLGSSGINVASGAGSETFGSGVSISLAASQSWTNNSANPLAINGAVSGGSSALLTVNGTGTVVLSGTNTFSGGLTATSGTIKATTSASALGAGSLTLGGAGLVLANDTGLNFGNATTISAGTTITSDRLTPGAGVTHSLGALIINASTLSTAAGSNVTSGAAGLTFGNVAFTGSPTFSVGSGTTLQFGATTFNNNTFTKSGPGTLVLTAGASNLAANSTNYQLLISGGTIQANANDVADQVSTTKQPILTLNPTSGTASFNAQTFNQSFFDLVVGGAYNFGTSTGSAGTAGTTANIAGTGTFTLTSTTAQVVFNGGLSTATGPVGSTIGPNLAGATTFNIGHVAGNAVDAIFSGSIDNNAATSWTKTGAGTMVVSGNSSTNTGTISVNQGTLSLQNANAIGSTAILTITPGAASSAFLDLGTGNTSFARPTGTSAGQITVGNNTLTAIDGFQTSSVTGASLNLNNGGSSPVWSQSGFQPGTLQLGTTSSLGPLKFVSGIQLLGANRPVQVDRGNFTLGSGNANLTSANNYFDAQIQGSLTSGTVAKSGAGVLSIAGTSTDTNANSYTVNNGILLLSNGSTGNAIGTDAVSVSTPAANTITALGGNGSTGGTVTFATSGTTNQSHLAPGNLILTTSNGAVSAIS